MYALLRYLYVPPPYFYLGGFLNTELKQEKTIQRLCALCHNPAKGCLMPHSLLSSFQCPGLVPFYFGIAEKLNIYKTQIPCLYFNGCFFPVLWQISAKILSTGGAVSSL